MRAGQSSWSWIGELGILLGVGSCAATPRPPSSFETLLSGLMNVRHRATLVYAKAQGASHPLVVVLDPEGGARLSILQLSSLEFETENLGELNRKDLIARLDGMEGGEFGGERLQFMGRFSRWRLRPIVRYGVPIGHLISVDPRLRFEIRTGTSGRIFSLMLRPSEAFIQEVRGEED